MALHWPTFFTRLGSAIVFALIMMAGLLWTPWAFLVLITLICLLCLREFFRITSRILQQPVPGWMLPATWVYSVIVLWLPPVACHFSNLPPEVAQQKFVPALLCGIPAIVLPAALSKKNALHMALIVGGALAYILMPCVMLYSMRLQSLLLPLALILLIWMNDTMAYLVGSMIGRTPFSAISPKKTWEGTAGGALLCLALALAWGYFSELFHLMDWAVLAICAAVAGTAGDLFESRLKRMADMKDSGTMMPGHGGALDRFDSLLVATPFAFGYAYLFMEALPIKVF
jgi:phosphatidate cytidylyltransferase